MQTVALQLPEGLQLFACTLADIIGAYAGVEVLPPRRKSPMQSWPNYPMPLSAAGARRGLPPWVCVGGARALYLLLTAIALAGSLAAIAVGALPRWYLVVAALLALAGIRAAGGISTDPAARAIVRRSIELTLAIHALGSLALIVTLLLMRP